MKKLIALLMCMLLVVGLMSACGTSGDPETKDDTNTTEDKKEDSSGDKEDSKEEMKDPSVITILSDSNDGWVRNYNPFIAGRYNWVQGFIYEYLVIFNGYDNNAETMWLAEDIISEADNKTLTIKVRQGIKWSDGEEFNAEDVAYSYTISKDHPALDNVGNWGENGKISEVNILDDYTVEIVMNEANAFHRADVPFQALIIPEHIWSQVEDPSTYVQDAPVATGAFTEVVSFEPEMVLMGRNPLYWKVDELEVDQMRLPQFTGNEAALALLQTGQVDWAHMFIPDAETTYVQGDPNRKFWFGMNDAVRLSFNYMTENENNLKAFTTPEFKIAASMAVDRKGIIDSAVFGYLDKTVPPVTGLPPALLGSTNDEAQKLHAEYTTYDLDAAKKVLTDAGFVDQDGDGWVDNLDGTPIMFDILSPAGWTDWNAGAIIAAEGMREIGINANANAVDLGIIIEAWESGAHDCLYGGYGLSTNIWKFYFDTIGDSSRILTPSWWSTNQNNYVNEEISEMIAELPMADAARAKEITDYIELYFTENMINIPLLYNGNWFVYNDGRFTGWATAEDPFVQPNCVTHDSKILQLLSLKPVK